jgi:hypothetical protein
MTNLFRTPAPPPVAAAAPMPDAMSPAVIEAQKTATAAALARGGRASTIQGRQGAAGPSRAPTATAADSFGGRSLGTAAP